MRKTTLVVVAGMLLLCSALLPSAASALVAAHLDFDGCYTCHALHGGPSSSAPLLNEADAESTCLACHGPLGIATEVAIHDPLGHGSGNFGYITCLECHNPHTNGDDLATPRTNSAGGYNIRLIGREADFKVREETAIGIGAYKDVVFEVSPDDWTRPDGFGLCQTCHVAPHNEGADCRGCHDHSGGFAGAGCTGCHDGSGGGALKVGPGSPHSETLTGYSCEDCHTAHSSGTIEIPNNPTVGINYGSNGESGIALGSAVATGGTEAEICWNCHALEGVSEWGVNTNSNGGVNDYDFGSLSGPLAPAWVNAAGDSGSTWTSANFSYKTSTIQSTHSVDGTATVPGLDPVANLRCSYCHDVHDVNNLASDNSSGKPYLRGTWMGNPYREDGAPSNIAGGLPGDVADYSAHDVGGQFGAVPRGGPGYSDFGGYFIDQNSGSPTANVQMDSPDKFAGLCRVCHEGTSGTADDGVWQAAEIDALNKFGTPGDDWVANSNSHARVVKGGSGSGAVNLFTVAKRQSAWAAYSGNGSERGNPVMAYHNALSYDSKNNVWDAAYWAQGLRGTDGTAFQFAPRVDTSTRQYNYGNYSWGATIVSKNGDGTMSESGIDAGFHQFTCSKCHNPHASRLPRLLITNCLDTRHNTWDDSYATDGTPSAGENRNVTFSQATSAQNCHRLADPNYPQASPQGTTTGGWNRVSPW